MILKDLPVGARVREQKSAVVFLVADHNHTAYAGTSLVTDCAVKIASFDALEPDNPDNSMKEFGNNFYPVSNIHRWLNSDEVDWFKPAHEFDAPPVIENIDQGRLDFYDFLFYSSEAKFIGDFSYRNAPGFLTWFSREFVESIYEVNLPCYIEPEPGSVHIGPLDPTYVRSKVFLLSAPEMGFEATKTGIEGFRFPLFNDARMRVVAPTPAAIGKPDDYVYDDCSFWYWLRTPVLGSKNMAMVYNSDHKFGDYNAAFTGQLHVRAISGIRPALNLDSGVAVSGKPDKSGVYSFLMESK